MEEIEFCKADFLYMLNELNKYAIENDVEDVWIRFGSNLQNFDFSHKHQKYEWFDNPNGYRSVNISLIKDTHESAYEKYERMMAVMKEGALL